jgi:hypothetical protein
MSKTAIGTTWENGKKKGIELRQVTPGYNAVVHHGDGTATKYHGTTEPEAKEKALDAIADGEL